jgi:hypothetical protein
MGMKSQCCISLKRAATPSVLRFRQILIDRSGSWRVLTKPVRKVVEVFLTARTPYWSGIEPGFAGTINLPLLTCKHAGMGLSINRSITGGSNDEPWITTQQPGATFCIRMHAEA